MLVVGAMGFAKELFETLKDCGIKELTFFDDYTLEPRGCIFGNYSVIRSFEKCREYFLTNRKFLLGVGGVEVRKLMSQRMEDCGGELAGIVSPHSRMGSYNRVDLTATVMMNVIIENDNVIGRGSLLHVGAFVSHDVIVGDFCEISPYVKLLGRCEIGESCSIGTGAIILPRIKVGDRAIVGAGAVVTSDVEPGTTVVGVPAKRIK